MLIRSRKTFPTFYVDEGEMFIYENEVYICISKVPNFQAYQIGFTDQSGIIKVLNPEHCTTFNDSTLIWLAFCV